MKKYMLIVLVLCFSCKSQEVQKDTIEGLWLVNKVKVGEDEMTPVARWMQFDKDSTQTSGNGWLQHSYGSWSLNEDNLLKINNENGLTDSANPFEIKIEDDTMVWNRMEEGQNVQVFLQRINERPTSEGNKLMGLWKLESYTVSGKDVFAEENPNNNQTLYLSWDSVFRENNLTTGRRVGIYKVHGHKPELQMVNYGETPKFDFWKFSLKDNILTLTSTDNKAVKTYHRIHKFLQ